MLAECYWNGTGVKQSLKTAVSLYKKAADAGYMLAQYLAVSSEAAYLYTHKSQFGVTSSPT
jgi:TPR repeat protein